MNTAVIGEGVRERVEVLELLQEKEVSAEQLRRLQMSGVLDMLLEKDADLSDARAIQAALGLVRDVCTVVTDYKSVEGAMSTCRGYLDSRLKEVRLEVQSGYRSWETRAFDIEKDLELELDAPYELIVSCMKRKGWPVATFTPLCGRHAAAFPEDEDKGETLAYGSPVSFDGELYVQAAAAGRTERQRRIWLQRLAGKRLPGARALGARERLVSPVVRLLTHAAARLSR